MSKLPTIVSNIPRDLRLYLDRVREALNAGGTDALVTYQDLVNAGVITYTNGSAAASSSTPNYGTPPAPTNLTATGALASIQLSWDDPIYTGHALAEVWASPDSTLGNAVLIGITSGSLFTHVLGGGATRWYWVRFVNRNGVAGAYNSVTGTSATTGTDPAYLLSLLNGQISETELAAALSTRIDLIDAGAGTPGSVDARIATETTARVDGDNALSSSITTLQSTVNGNTSAIQTEASTRASETGDLFAQYTVKVDVNGYVSGFGLASTAINGTPTSTFIIRADSFSVADPSATIAATAPFIVRTTPTTINGVSVPAGIYMTDAYIQNGSIANAKIGNLAVDTAKIADLAVTNAKIGSLAVTEAKIANAAITNAKIGNLAVATGNIQDAAITNAKIGSLAVGTANIANAAVTNAQIGNLAVGSAQIADLAVTNAKIGNLAVDTAKIGSLAVERIKIAKGGQLTSRAVSSLSLPVAADVASSTTTDPSYWPTVSNNLTDAHFDANPTRYKLLGDRTYVVDANDDLAPEQLFFECGVGRSPSFQLNTSSTSLTELGYGFYVRATIGGVLKQANHVVSNLSSMRSDHTMFEFFSGLTNKFALEKGVDYAAGDTITFSYYYWRSRDATRWGVGQIHVSLSLTTEEYYR